MYCHIPCRSSREGNSVEGGWVGGGWGVVGVEWLQKKMMVKAIEFNIFSYLVIKISHTLHYMCHAVQESYGLNVLAGETKT